MRELLRCERRSRPKRRSEKSARARTLDEMPDGMLDEMRDEMPACVRARMGPHNVQWAHWERLREASTGMLMAGWWGAMKYNRWCSIKIGVIGTRGE